MKLSIDSWTSLKQGDIETANSEFLRWFLGNAKQEVINHERRMEYHKKQIDYWKDVEERINRKLEGKDEKSDKKVGFNSGLSHMTKGRPKMSKRRRMPTTKKTNLDRESSFPNTVTSEVVTSKQDDEDKKKVKEKAEAAKLKAEKDRKREKASRSGFGFFGLKKMGIPGLKAGQLKLKSRTPNAKKDISPGSSDSSSTTASTSKFGIKKPNTVGSTQKKFNFPVKKTPGKFASNNNNNNNKDNEGNDDGNDGNDENDNVGDNDNNNNNNDNNDNDNNDNDSSPKTGSKFGSKFGNSASQNKFKFGASSGSKFGSKFGAKPGASKFGSKSPPVNQNGGSKFGSKFASGGNKFGGSKFGGNKPQPSKFGNKPQSGPPKSNSFGSPPKFGNKPQGGPPKLGNKPQGGPSSTKFGNKTQGGPPKLGNRPQGGPPKLGNKPQGGPPKLGNKSQGGLPPKFGGNSPSGGKFPGRPSGLTSKFGGKPPGKFGKPKSGSPPNQATKPAGFKPMGFRKTSSAGSSRTGSLTNSDPKPIVRSASKSKWSGNTGRKGSNPLFNASLASAIGNRFGKKPGMKKPVGAKPTQSTRPVQSTTKPQQSALKNNDTEEKKAKVLFDFSKDEDGYLEIKQGETIGILSMEDKQWWIGIKDGKKGYVPHNYIELVGAADKSGTDTKKGNGKAVALFDFTRDGDEYVDVTKGDELVIVGDDQEGEWMMVEIKGKQGFVPTSYVKPISDSENATVLHQFKGEGENYLDVEEGDKVAVIDKGEEWWEVQLNGNIGFVPASFLKLETK